MSDSNAFNRRHLLGLGAAGAIGGAAGYLLGRRSQDDTSRDDDRRVTPGPLAEYEWNLTVRGGYGWWFKKNGNKTNVMLMALKPDCTCNNHECVEHKMTLIAFKTAVEVTGETTYGAGGSGNVLTWELKGPTKFIKGMPGDGITELRRTKWDDISDPHAPYDPDRDDLWNDQVWLPERLKAKNNAEEFASARFLLTDGRLAVGKPNHDQARTGRFVFKVNGTDKKKALTDQLVLTGRTTDAIGIETEGGKIVLKPKLDAMFLYLRHAFILRPETINPGDKLKHYKRLFDFVDRSKCADGEAPAFQKRTDIEGSDTPGDLCPPIPLD